MSHVFVYDGRLDWLNFLPFDFENLICVDFYDDKNTKTYDLILKLHKEYPHKKILFYNKSEGFQKGVYRSINEIVTKFIENDIFLPSDFFILNGCFPHPYNVNLYNNFIEKNNFLKLKTFFVNTMELMLVDALKLDKTNTRKFLSDLKYDVTKKHKNFLLYIGKVSQHRLYILSELAKLGFLNNSYYSCYFEKYVIDKLSPNKYPHYLRDSISYVKSISDTFPIKLESNDNFQNLIMWGFKEAEKFHYEDSFFSIIPETHFVHNDQNRHEEYIFDDQVFITEKTYRIIAGKLPFIMVSFTNTLQILRDSGYKTFHPFIDESYDQIENDEERLKAIINEIKRLCNFSQQEWAIWAENIIPIIEHNQKVLFSCSPKYVEIY